MLTPRERQVMKLVYQGCTAREAADRLCVSKRTIDFHVANVYSKLGINNRIQAFRRLKELGVTL